MDKNTALISIYRLLDSEKPVPEFLKNIIESLENSYPGTAWNIGVISESTEKIKYVRTGAPFTNVLSEAGEAYSKGKQIISKTVLPAGPGWMFSAPLVYERQKLGVIACIAEQEKEGLDSIGEDVGFVLQQYRLKLKLLNNSLMMNSIIMSSQGTAASKDIEPLVRMLAPQLKKYLSADGIRIYMWDREIPYYFDSEGSRHDYYIENENSIVGSVRLKNRPLMLKDAFRDPDYNPGMDSAGKMKETKNLIAVPIKVSDQVKGVLLVVSNDDSRVFVGSELVWVKSVCGEIEAAMERLKLYEDIQKLFLSSIEAMAAAIDGKDPYTHGHSRRVTMFSVFIGKELGLDDKKIEEIRLSALLHDIGKIAIPESILLKVEELTDEEWAKLKQHPELGEKILKPVEEFRPLLPGIRHHHERYDGRGYPDGLKGKKIPLIARIITVADAFDAMTSKRLYRDALTEDQGIEEIQNCKSTQFDPEIADAFIGIYKKHFI
ncbi:MAG: HD domain-containing protein [Elusimicrobia bacterium]|nr:HD domain-containing protein [Elusimicrobiota bacterium]